MPNEKVKSILNQTFNFLTVIEFVGVNRHRMSTWKARCVCGNERVLTRGNLVSGNTKSCGCKNIELHTTHGHAVRFPGTDQKSSATYACWGAMKNRCLNPKNNDYKDYGGRGIKVCQDWMLFENFLRDMGVRPDGMSIDRKNNDGDYCKENCVWIPLSDQQSNRRNTRNITVNGVTKSISQWSKIQGISKVTLRNRVVSGWPTDRLFITPKFRH